MEDLRYPIGQYVAPDPVTANDRKGWCDRFAAAPSELRSAVKGLSDKQLDTSYRPGGWSARQVVHHIPDSHTNGYVRFRLALTEDSPTIKPYNEAAWAELPEGKDGPVEPSLTLLEALHRRWMLLLEAMRESDWTRTLHHPEVGKVRLDECFGSYAWHCEHHVAHITRLRQRESWT